MRKVYVDVKVRLIVTMEDGIDLNDVINEMEYDFTYCTPDAVIDDTEIENWEVTDSK